jgi:hypothetical protein
MAVLLVLEFLFFSNCLLDLYKQKYLRPPKIPIQSKSIIGQRTTGQNNEENNLMEKIVLVFFLSHFIEVSI